MSGEFVWIGIYQDKSAKLHWTNPDLEWKEWTGVGKKMPWGDDEPSDKGQCTKINLIRETDPNLPIGRSKSGKWFMFDCDREYKFMCETSTDIPVECQNGYTEGEVNKNNSARD